MVATPSERYETNIQTLKSAAEAGDVDQRDAELIRELCSAYDAEDATVDLPRQLYERNRSDSHKSYGTLGAWASRLTAVARDIELATASASDINAYTTSLVKADDGPGTARVESLEYALKKFYRYHSNLGVDPQAITVHQHDREKEGWDATDMLDADERLAMRTVADHPRDLAIYHLLIYTGLRNTALRTLRVGDIDLDRHEWYFNRQADGLKDVHDPREPRPLFQAERAVRDWLQYHPTGRDEDYLITAKPKYAKVDATEPVSHETIRRVMKVLKDRTHERDDLATVDKPCHPHMMRHNFVSMCLKHPDITDGDIKFYLGHAPGSNVMETTYGHLSSEDHNQAGHGAFGVSAAAHDGDDLDPWDTTCPHCDRVLHPKEDSCENCGTERATTPWDDAARQGVDMDFGALRLLAELGEIDLTPEQVDELAEDPSAREAFIRQRADG